MAITIEKNQKIQSLQIIGNIYICIYVCVCVCVCDSDVKTFKIPKKIYN